MKTPLSHTVSALQSKSIKNTASVGEESITLTGLGAAALIGAATGLATQLSKNLTDTAAKSAKTLVQGDTEESSFSEFTQSTTLNPMALVESSLVNYAPTADILNALVNVFSAYYLQAISLTTKIDGVSVVKRLEPYSTNRKADFKDALLKDAKNAALAGHLSASKEAIYEVSPLLPNFKDTTSIESLHLLSLEAKNTQPPAPVPSPQPPKQTVNNIKGELRNVHEVGSLAVGKMLNVTLTVDNNQVSVPVQVRILPQSMPEMIMEELLVLGDIKESWGERWDRYRAGDLSFTDWMFQSDIIRNKKRLMAMDKNGVYREILKRRNENRKASAITGKKSLGAASAFIIITKSMADRYEERTGYKLNKQTVPRIFQENSAMLLAIVDPEWETVDLYTRGVPGVAQYTLNHFKTMGKGSGPDIKDLLQAYLKDQQPRF